MGVAGIVQQNSVGDLTAMGTVCLGLDDEFDLVTAQTQATVSLSLQLSFAYILHLMFKHISAFPEHKGTSLVTNKAR